MGNFDSRRARIRDRLRNPPFGFPPGLAHLIATVAEPRSDGIGRDHRLDGIVEEHRERLIREIRDVLADVPQEPTNMRSYGGRVEHTVDAAATRLRQVAEEHGEDRIVERLDRLRDERRTGVLEADAYLPELGLEIEYDELPRSSTSGRRVGVWR